MSRLIYITLVWLLQLTVANASTFNLRVEVTPLGSGSLNIAGGTYEEGSKISLRTYNNTGYVFKGWYEGDSLLSEDNYFNYTMPSKDVVVQAKYEFDPEVPANPDTIATKYTLTVTCKPVGGGAFNVSNEKVEGGSNVHIYAYTNTGYKFLCWEDEKGGAISTSQDFNYVMPYENTKVYGVFEYDPEVPGNPNKNYWNKDLGEVIVDDFKPGSLNNAISSAIGKDNRNDVTMIIVAGRMNNNDFGIANNYPNCTLLDLSRVTGISEIPSYAFDYTQLESVYLPATIENIGYAAFFDCKQLAALTIYAMTPPTLEGKVLNGVSDGLMVYVPASSISKYQEADGWKNFTILPIQEDIRSLTISLPEGTNVQDYAMMWLELNNTKNGQKMHYVMTDRMQYTFANIISNTTWNVVLRNERGDVFGQIDNVEVKDENVSVSFTKLSKPQNVALKVKTPDGQDVTNQTQITWTDASGNYMAQGVSIKGLPSGCQVNYRLVLSQDMSMVYETPQASTYTLKEGDNNLICQLDSIKKVQLSGKVKDVSTGLSLNGAVISASQTFGGKYSKTLIAKTDGNGVFTLNVSNVPTSVAYAATDFVSQTIVCDSLMNGEAVVTLPQISLKPISGATITIDFTYTTDEGETQNWYSGYQNVSFAIQNLTKNHAISQFNVQYPQIVLLENVEDGDELKLTATSRTNAFMPAESIVTIANQSASASFAITELGKIHSAFKKNNNTTVVGSLYDVSGKLIKTYNYSSAQLTISNLTDGQYTLVTMGGSRLFNTIYDLVQLPQTGLTEGSDYVQNTVEVKSGVITTIHNDEVPTLDESKLYYTGDNTSFTVNKPSIVAGNYLTLTGRIDFKSAYASSVSNVQMIVDLPESCQFVENSVMVGNSTSSYTLNGHQITIPLTHYTDRVRFCIIPTLGGKYAPSALVQFDLNGGTVTQPIGSATYTANDLSISVPSMVAKNTVPISGTAIGTSNVEIYDNNVLIGQTTSLANGTWVTTCELNAPYNLSTHNIYAKVTTKAGTELASETKQVVYDKSMVEPEKVTMLYYNPEYVGQYNIVFDLINGTVSPNHYYFFPYKSYPNWWGSGTEPKEFTFVADLSNNDSTAVNGVTIRVYTDNGNWRNLEAQYNTSMNRWVAVSQFLEEEAPVGVDVVLNEISKEIVQDREYLTELLGLTDVSISNTSKEIESISSILASETYMELSGTYDELYSILSGDIVDVDKLDELLGKVMDTNKETDYDDEILDERIKKFYINDDLLELEYVNSFDSICNSYFINSELKDFILPTNSFSAQLDNDDYKGTYKVEQLDDIDTEQLILNGYNRCSLTDNTNVYFKFSEDEISFVDAKTNIKYTFNLERRTIVNNSRRKISSTYDFENFAGCLSAIQHGTSTLRSFSNNIIDAKSECQRVVDILYLISDGISCFYMSAYGQLQKMLNDVHAQDVAKTNAEIESLEDLAGQTNSRIIKNEKEIKNLNKAQKGIEEDRKALSELMNSTSISESERTFYQNKYNGLEDQWKTNNVKIGNLRKSIDGDVKAHQKIIERIGKLNLQKLAKEEGYINASSKLCRMPARLTRGAVTISKTVSTLGKLAGPLGVLIEAWSLFCDLDEGINEINEWKELLERAQSYFPCEGDSAKLEILCNDINSDTKKVIGHALSIFIVESDALALDIASLRGFNIYVWLVSGFLNGYGEFAKNKILGDYIQKRGNYYVELMNLKCIQDKCPRCGKNPCVCKDKCPRCGNRPCTCPEKCLRCGKNPCVCPPPTNTTHVQHDPSGYVYEGVASNRLQGVMASCYYKETVEDMYGDLHDNVVLWNAEEYAQENPLFTDEYGMYRWDVPKGLWQVKFEKEGYETTYSEWLPVPPPQLDVNIPMKQNIQPTVKLARAFEDAVEVEFDKYMVPEFLTTDNIMVMQGDKAVKGTIELLNEEVSYEGETETFASKIRFNAAQAFTEKEIALIINNRVKSYAGIRMQDDYQQTFAIEQEIKQILSDSLIVVEYGEKAALTVSVLPASASKGKTLSVRNSSPMILGVEAEQVTIGEDGKAEISISGELPGTAALVFTIEGTDKTAITIVNVKQTDSTTVAVPTASIASGSVVEKGTQVSLFCETEGAIIYFTTDGSCPCDENGTRAVYDGTPIVIDKSMTVKAMAVAKDLNDSEIAEFIYTVLDGDGVESVIINDEIQVYPLPVRDILNISADGQIIKNVKIMALNGRTITTVNKPAKTVTLDVSSMASGVYIVFVTLENGNYSRKFVKVQ